jgi:lipopolysaccharide export system protein LptA
MLIAAFTALIMAIIAAGHAAAFDMTLQSREPIRIQADSAELDELKGVATYQGDVIISQGRSIIEASRITVYTSRNRGINRLDAVGTPAHLRQYDPVEKTETNAYARRIDYRREDNRVALRGGARLEQASSVFRGEEILYDTLSQVVTAKSSDPARNGEQADGKQQRVEIIYFPPEDEDSNGGSEDPAPSNQ